jgi:hypothetical protein
LIQFDSLSRNNGSEIRMVRWVHWVLKVHYTEVRKRSKCVL